MHLILEILRYVFTWSLIALWVYGIQSTGERVPGTPGIKSWRGSHYYRYIRPKFAILWFKMFSTDHNEILHMSRQCNCRDVCKISLWSAEYIMNKTITKFHWISNSFETLLVGRAPCLTREDKLISFQTELISLHQCRVNTLRPRQDGRHFADAIFTCIFFNENCCILIKFSLQFVRNGPINNIPALVQITASHRPGDKPLSGPMMVRLPTHICVTRPQWVNNKCEYNARVRGWSNSGSVVKGA